MGRPRKPTVQDAAAAETEFSRRTVVMRQDYVRRVQIVFLQRNQQHLKNVDHAVDEGLALWLQINESH